MKHVHKIILDIQHKESVQILRIGLTILSLSVLWYLLASKVAARPVLTSVPPEVDRRLDAVKKYHQDKNQNEFEYETDILPPPLAGDRDQEIMKKEGKVSEKPNQ